MIEGGLWDGYKLWDLYDWAQTPFQWQKHLFEYAQDIGITCISTPFDETAVDLLEDLKKVSQVLLQALHILDSLD